jgi:ribosome biogenesis GTPase
VSDKENAGYIADTPGFSLLDFERFNFFDKEDLAYNMREFRDYIGECRYTKCSHTKEEGCAILDAVREGKISKSRHDSFLEIYAALKNKNKWDNK